MKKLNIATLLCGLILFITSCGGSTTPTSVDEVETTAKSVAEGEVAIGTQIWTSKNLDVSNYRNGDKIPQVQDADTWGNLTTDAWSYYENKTANGTKYGKLYNWYAVNDPRGLAPKGYHIPTDEEWTILTDYLGGNKLAGAKMKTITSWKKNGNGNNSSGFEGLPGGFRFNDEFFSFIGACGYWWSSSENDNNGAWCRYLDDNNGDVGRNDNDQENGMSVRCIKD